MGRIVVNKHFDVKSNITPESFAFCDCLKLSEILIKTLTPPSLDFSTDMEIVDGISYKLYHPFGFRKNSFVGFSTKENGNVLYVPYNNNGYLTNEDFVTKYRVTEYALDAVMSVSRSTTLFSSDLFGTSSTVDLDSNTEMANITKLEYEILVSKVNQLMKLLKNKK